MQKIGLHVAQLLCDGSSAAGSVVSSRASRSRSNHSLPCLMTSEKNEKQIFSSKKEKKKHRTTSNFSSGSGSRSRHLFSVADDDADAEGQGDFKMLTMSPEKSSKILRARSQTEGLMIQSAQDFYPFTRNNNNVHHPDQDVLLNPRRTSSSCPSSIKKKRSKFLPQLLPDHSCRSTTSRSLELLEEVLDYRSFS